MKKYSWCRSEEI